MINEQGQKGSNSSRIEKEISIEHDQILKEYKKHKITKPKKYSPGVTTFVIPATAGNLHRVVTLEKTNCEYKRLIFSAIYTAYYEYFFTENYTPSVSRELHVYAPFVVNYLNSYTFVEGNELDFFKSYEAYRINESNILPSSTGLSPLIKWMILASTLEIYSKNLAYWQAQFFASVCKIKALGVTDYEKKQVTMTDWFGLSTWLRRDEVGIGHELYSKLASPKSLVKSFVATITVELNEIQLAKDALIKLLIDQRVKSSDFPPMKEKGSFRNQSVYENNITSHRAYVINKLREIYHSSKYKDEHLKLAMMLVVRELTSEHSREFVLERFFRNRLIRKRRRSDGKIIEMIATNSHETLFGSRLLTEMVEYTNQSGDRKIDKPKSVAEQIIFSWLMAYQTVQPTDILKLKLRDFKFVKRANGRVTHIDLEYFKGRANITHQVKTLDAKTLLGSVILKYIQDLSNKSTEDGNKKLITKSIRFNTTFDKLFEICGDELAGSIEANLIKEKVSPVFIKAMLVIIKNGKRYSPKGNISYQKYLVSADRIVRKQLFSLTAIKNSSVHSRSDTFTPTQLINFHSHSDDVEKRSYLTSSNEEWLNNAGLITRTVMQDLTKNLYRASKVERKEFNSEFGHAAKIIMNKKADTLSQMKMANGKEQGEINYLGLVKKIVNSEDDYADTIYLLDTPETVFKLLHYLNQVKQKHHLLVTTSSEFLLFTVLPTVEWIEELFDMKSFSNASMAGGQKFFKQYGNDLPPLFQNQIS